MVLCAPANDTVHHEQSQSAEAHSTLQRPVLQTVAFRCNDFAQCTAAVEGLRLQADCSAVQLKVLTVQVPFPFSVSLHQLCGKTPSIQWNGTCRALASCIWRTLCLCTTAIVISTAHLHTTHPPTHALTPQARKALEDRLRLKGQKLPPQSTQERGMGNSTMGRHLPGGL